MVALEAIACREALALADNLLIYDFMEATDSKQVANDILRGSSGAYGQILAVRSLNFNCTFWFEGRASNTEAHC